MPRPLVEATRQNVDIRVKLTPEAKARYVIAARRDLIKEVSVWLKSLAERRVAEQQKESTAAAAGEPPHTAWFCPRCNTMNAPWSRSCDGCEQKKRAALKIAKKTS